MDVDVIFARFDRCGDLRYGESVTQTAHALQTAALAEADDADDSMVAAALLHDFGHLGEAEPDTDIDVDDRHEIAGAAHLAAVFLPDVTEPIRLHVAAKRYLCAVDRDYMRGLSDASLHGLELQGGPFGHEDTAAFEAEPFAHAAVELRRWDDAAKVPDAPTRELRDYRELLSVLAGDGRA